ncbi:MAG: putative lipoprotein, partial [Reyranella sp.]|nr:putative lipoprotein [Reyranella sp.]
MRTLLSILLLVLAAACTQAPTPKKIVQAKDLQHLGPCPASFWKPEAPPLSSSAKTSMVLLAVGEWGRFGKQVITHSNDAPAKTEQLGIKERDAPQRIGDYWKAVDVLGRTGLNDIPWSAAFISWDIESAGVP